MISRYLVPGPDGKTFFLACLVGSWDRLKMVGFALSLSLMVATILLFYGEISGFVVAGLACAKIVLMVVHGPCRGICGVAGYGDL